MKLINFVASSDHLLVPVDKEPWDTNHKEFLDKVAELVGEIVYHQFRQDWFLYQKCIMDVVGFAKKVKLAFRGSRVHLREGARVLVDEQDQEDFDDVLAGKIVESKKREFLITFLDLNHCTSHNTLLTYTQALFHWPHPSPWILQTQPLLQLLLQLQ